MSYSYDLTHQMPNYVMVIIMILNMYICYLIECNEKSCHSYFLYHLETAAMLMTRRMLLLLLHQRRRRRRAWAASSWSL